MYKIGIIGDRESVMGFMALGFSVMEAADVASARTLLHRAARSGEYAVLFLTENYAAELDEELAEYANAPLPAITVLPGRDGGNGCGMARIRQAVERAVGTDILFKD